jgi:Rad3-related DNA helicase
MWHTKNDREAQYANFIARGAETGAVLVACGMYEGIDLSYDLARWQAICKVPYPSLGDAAVNERMIRRPESYAWSAIRDLLQATGRVCRSPTDTGITYILDSNFKVLRKRYPDLFPDWFTAAIREKGSIND